MQLQVQRMFLSFILLILVSDGLISLTGLRGRLLRLPPDIHNQSELEQHESFMTLALQQAKKAARKGEVPIGAVVVERTAGGKFRVLSQGRNMIEKTHDASAHAELIAMKRAGHRVKNWRLLNATLYSTLEPCPMCLSAAQAFRVSKIVYGAPDLRLGAIETHIRLLDIKHPMHTIEEVVPGVNSDESANLLREFFRQRRKESGNKAGLGGPGVMKRIKIFFSTK